MGRVCAHPLKKVPVSNWKILTEKRTGPQSEEESSHRTFGVGAREVQLLDLRGPRHGRQHLEGVLAVDLLAVANVELQQSPKHLEVLELACMRARERGREESGQCAVSHSKEWKIPEEKRTGPQL